ncbi:MAG: hypothetical protein O7C67_18205 [Gammaproteobacteria bacterium]|nr:hypothetical protein [Gammaproteobacteria bacterium]MCZ6659223.1 hypothetical protein [Gammaproteobacteria bacterium]
MTDTTTESACSLDAEAMNERWVLFQERLLGHALRTTRIDGGLRVTFPNDPALLAELRALIALERQCCGFLDFQLTKDIDDSRSLLSITGPREAQAVLRQLESAFAGNDDKQTGAARHLSNALLKRTGLLSITTGLACLLVCELPVLLTVIGLTGIATSLSYLQPGPAIEAGASVLIVAGSIVYVVWRRRFRHTRSST